MADHMNDGERPRGNRPADNAKQATPGSLSFQKGWQGNALAGDFLGLNDGDAPVVEPVVEPVVPAPVARTQPSPPAPRPEEGESWLLSADEPVASTSAPRAVTHVAPATQPEYTSPSDAEDARPEYGEEVAPHAESDTGGDDQENSSDAAEGGYRAPNVLDASWTEPAAPRRVPKRPVLAAACVLGVLAVGGYVALGPKPAPREIETTATVDAVTKTPRNVVSHTEQSGTGPTVAPAPEPEAGESSPGSAAPTNVEELRREGETTPSMEGGDGAPMDAPDAPSGRVALDVHGQAQPAPVEVASPELGAQDPEPAVAPVSPSVTVVAKNEPIVAEPASSEGNPGATPPAVKLEGETTRSIGDTPPRGELAAATPPKPVADISRPRFQAPGTSPHPIGGPEQANVGDSNPVNPAPGNATTGNATTGNAASEGSAPEKGASPHPTVVVEPAKGPDAAPSAAPNSPAPNPKPAPVAEPVKVLGSQSTSLADAAKDRPAADEHPSAVPSTPPVPPAKPAEGAAVAAATPTVTDGANPNTTPGANAAPGASPTVGPEPAHESRDVALPPKDVILPSISVEGVRTAQGKDLDGVWSADTIPMDRIDNPTKILTPSVGDVRVTLKSKDVFEGRLYAVGQNSVWIEGPFGRLGLTHDRIASVDKVGAPAPAATPTAGGVQKFGRVRVKTGGGSLLGTVTSIDGDKMKVVTDSGLKLTVDSKDVEPYVEEPKIVIKQPAKQG